MGDPSKKRHLPSFIVDAKINSTSKAITSHKKIRPGVVSICYNLDTSTTSKYGSPPAIPLASATSEKSKRIDPTPSFEGPKKFSEIVSHCLDVKFPKSPSQLQETENSPCLKATTTVPDSSSNRPLVHVRALASSGNGFAANTVGLVASTDGDATSSSRWKKLSAVVAKRSPSPKFAKLIRARCRYGAACYRKNPDHLAEFLHPRDPEWNAGATLLTAPALSSRRPKKKINYVESGSSESEREAEDSPRSRVQGNSTGWGLQAEKKQSTSQTGKKRKVNVTQ
jgi:hypothetical protein